VPEVLRSRDHICLALDTPRTKEQYSKPLRLARLQRCGHGHDAIVFFQISLKNPDDARRRKSRLLSRPNAGDRPKPTPRTALVACRKGGGEPSRIWDADLPDFKHTFGRGSSRGYRPSTAASLGRSFNVLALLLYQMIEPPTGCGHEIVIYRSVIC
jgi:hypothetical protein